MNSCGANQATALCLLLVFSCASLAAEPIDIGSRLQLFVDDYLIEATQGSVRRHVVRPEPRDVVFETDEAWEGNTSGYFTLFQDGDTYRMIYRGWQHDEAKKAAHKEVTCYAESHDGEHWTKPDLGLFDWNGSRDNNIIWLGPGTHNFTAFRDDNPKVSADTRYKALAGIGSFGGGLIPLGSPDCIHWKLLSENPVVTHGAFDSQNLAFWDGEQGHYRAYWRHFDNGVRAIRTATSRDFVHWENEADLAYTAGTPSEHLYTNAIQKYFRAPELYIGFPTRYDPQSQQVEPILMTSRDGVNFQRHGDAVIPRTAPADRNHNRSNYMAWGMFQLPGKPREISVYATENYYERTPGRIRRFEYRIDGFVALQGGTEGGRVTTKPLRYRGERLMLNYVVKLGGSLSVEVLDDEGNAIGFSQELSGDAVDAAVDWKRDPNLGSGTIQLRFNIQNADLYSLRFE